MRKRKERKKHRDHVISMRRRKKGRKRSDHVTSVKARDFSGEDRNREIKKKSDGVLDSLAKKGVDSLAKKRGGLGLF